jgi:hypothetical protein
MHFLPENLSDYLFTMTASEIVGKLGRDLVVFKNWLQAL